MKAKLLRDSGEVTEGTEVEVGSAAGTNDARSDKDVGGRSTTPAPLYEVTDDEGHARRSTRETSSRCPSRSHSPGRRLSDRRRGTICR
jgi:hypothetical protein